jgi:hypothetical protein
MKTMFTIAKRLPHVLLSSVLGLLILAATLPGCGGVGSGGTGDGVATGYTAGPITGFGSVIVNGVRYDDTAATVLDGDGLPRSREDLRLGMTVEIDSGAVNSTSATARANSIRFDSELLGAVGTVNASAGSFTVLAQTVVTDAATVFDFAVGALSALKVGMSVEVFAVYDPANQRYRATRVGTATTSSTPHLRGLVAQVDAGAQTLKIGSATFAYAGAAGVPADLAAGQFVRLRLASSTPSAGRFAVLGFGTALRVLPDSGDARLTGVVSSFLSTSLFGVNGRPVDASGASFSNGTAGLKLGARVEVEGRLSQGVLLASKVKVVSEQEGGNQTFELHGPITAVNSAEKTFVVRGLTIGTGRADLRYENGTAANLVVGRSVEVKGKLSLDGLRIDAFNINFE